MAANENNLTASDDHLSPVYKLYLKGDYKEALSILDNLTQDFPNDSRLFSIGGDCYVPLNLYDQAILCYEEALKLSPDNIKLYIKKIRVLVLTENIEEALELCNEAIKIAPNNSDLFLSQGNIFHDLRNFNNAIESYNKVIKLTPKSAEAYCNKANSLECLWEFDEAIIAAKKAIQIKPDLSLAFFNLGSSAMHLNLFDLSMESFNKAIDLKPNYAKYEYAKGTLLLLYGDFKNGWPLWESRWRLNKLFSPKLETNCSVWTGDKNSKLLVWSEQGIGDQLMFSALLSDLSKKCKDLIVYINPRLISLLKRSMGDICTFYPDNKPIPALYDAQISIGSLGQYLREEEVDFESSRYGFLKDDKDKTAEIKKDIALSNKKICGISWRSKSPKSGDHKTIPLKYLIKMLNLDGYAFVSLQYGDTKDEINDVKSELGIDIVSYEKVDNFNDIDGLTSLIQACDTVITIDNITCQLAGALGKETHVLLTYGSSWWVWMSDRSDSLWYDSVKIYRQEANKTWHDSFKRLKQNLNK